MFWKKKEYKFEQLKEGKYAWNPLTNMYSKYTNQTTNDFDIIYYYKGKVILLEALKGEFKYSENKMPYLN